MLFVVVVIPVSFADSKYDPYYYYRAGVLEGVTTSEYEQKPNLELKCPCGASLVIDEFLDGSMLRRADKFIETHPCSHDTRLGENVSTDRGTITPTIKSVTVYFPQRLLVRELIGSEIAGFSYSRCVSDYNCIECGESLIIATCERRVYICYKCKKYFNIEKGN